MAQYTSLATGDWIMSQIDCLSLPFDQYQRYRAVAQIAGLLREHLGQPSLHLLDVGGLFYTRHGQPITPLSHFCRQDRIVAVDLSAEPLPNYIVADGGALPFNCSFDVVVTCDTLEHVPEPARADFLAELLRVSRHLLVLIAPFDDDSTRSAERLLRESLATHGIYQPQLQEHAERGLPDAGWLRSYLSEQDLAWLDLPDGYLHHWLAMMLVKHTPGYSLDFHLELDRYYNRHFSPHDRREPAYRRIFVVTQPGRENFLPAVDRALRKAATNDDRPDLMLALLGLLSQSAPEERDGQLSALQAENARLRSQIDGYERGRFIRFMAWLRARRAREYKGIGS